MDAEWKQDKAWSDKYLPEIKSILGKHLIQAAPVEMDQSHNTDLIVLKLDAVRIACRVRTSKYIDMYRDDFTIRSSRPSGAETELTKILAGWGDYFFYAHAGGSEKLQAWALCDLKVFRLWFFRQLTLMPQGVVPGKEKQNHDGSSAFRVFCYSDLPPEFVVAQEGIR